MELCTDWAIAPVCKGTVKHIYCSETKALRGKHGFGVLLIQYRTKAGRSLFNEISTDDGIHGQVDSYQKSAIIMMNAI